MTDTAKPKHRRARGSGSVYKIGKMWWISYRAPDGKRHAESSESERKGDAERMLQRIVGKRENGLPVVPKAEHLTFDDAAKAVVTDYVNNQKNATGLKRRIDKHLLPFFGGRRLVGIGMADVANYIARRKEKGIIGWKGRHKGQRIGDVSNAEINRSLQVLIRIFSLAVAQERIGRMPKIAKLAEAPPRAGFFEADQIASVLKHLPTELAAVVEFGYHTGWRIASEVLPLTWDRVDLKAGSVRLTVGTTKNKDARVVYMTAAMRRILEGRLVEHERLKQAGTIEPLVFFRMVAERRGGEKKPKAVGNFKRSWLLACRAAGCPGKLLHDLRRTAVRNLDRDGVSRTVAMKIVGHRTESMYSRYNITSDEDLRAAARTLDAAAAGKLKVS